MKNFSSLSLTYVTIIGLLFAIVTQITSCKPTVPKKEENNYYSCSGPEKVAELEFLMTRDPRTNSIPGGKLLSAKFNTEYQKEAARLSRIQLLNWTERGPSSDTMGISNNNRRGPLGSVTSGRIKAIMIDSLDPTKRTVFVGGASGGLWKTTNITASPAIWTPVDDFFSNLMITGITQDPNPGSQNIMYLCTGEIMGGAGKGVGIFKSLDGGASWTYLTSTSNNNFQYCNRILCDYTGNVYVATTTGLFRSRDEGNTWTNIAPVSGNVCDIEISSTSSAGRLHMIVGGVGSTQAYRYTSSPSTASTGSGWRSATTSFTLNSSRKADLAVQGNTLYAIPSSNADTVPNVFKSTDGGANWQATGALPSVTGGKNFAGNQAWFALMVGINPANPNECIVGGLDCLRTLDGGNTWTQISSWLTATDNYMHADHHILQWWDNGNKLLFGNDGGVFYSSNKGTTIRDRNVGLRIKQFYSVETHPNTTNYFIGGTQDNGNHLVNTASIGRSIEVRGGDGAYVAIDQNEPSFQFLEYVQNVYARSNDNGQTWRGFSINPNSGLFINPFDYDNIGNRIYASDQTGTYLRWDNPQTAVDSAGSTVTSISMTGTNGFGSEVVSAVHVSPFTANRVFFGLSGGSIRRVSNAHTASPSSTSISPPSIVGSWVKCVTTGRSENNLMAIYSNYGVTNIWVSTNGGTNWIACDGNLPDMPVRWAIFHPDTDAMAIIATETGVWETGLLDGSNTIWTPSTNFPNVRVDMLHYRATDRRLVAATHGRGLWSTVLPITSPSFTFSNPPPATTPCPAPLGMGVNLAVVPDGGFNGLVTLSASGLPPGTGINFSVNPVPASETVNVRLIGTNSLLAGRYTITITGTGAGVATQTRQLTYEITADPLKITDHPDDRTICEGYGAIFSTIATGSELSYQWQKSTNNGVSWVDISGATTNSCLTAPLSTSNSGEKYRCRIISSCTNETKYTRAALLTIVPSSPISISPSSSLLCSGEIQRLVISPNKISGSATFVNDVAKDIPDYSATGTNSLITVAGLPDGAIITGIQISMNILHSYVGDLVVNLKSPSGQVLNLVNRLNNGTGTNTSNNFTNTKFDSTFTPSLSLATAPRTGNFRADRAQTVAPTAFPTTATNWRSLYNSNPNGDWVLAVADLSNYDAGVLSYWSISISYTRPLSAVWRLFPNMPGSAFLDAAGTIAYANTEEDTIYAKPIVNTSYSVNISNSACIATPSSVNILVQQPVINFVSSPSTISVCQNAPFTLTSSYTPGPSYLPFVNTPPTYQWQVNTAGVNQPSWTNIVGATNSTYTVNQAALSENGSQYRCVATTACGAPVITNYSTVTVNPFTRIITNPTSQTVCEGTNVNFSVTAEGGSLTYQWQKSGMVGNQFGWINISGANGPTYTVVAPTAAQNGEQYRCLVGGSCTLNSSTLNSIPATLTVVNSVSFTEQPLTQTVCAGTDATFSVATNANLLYQWQQSTNGGSTWTYINGATSSSYTVPAVNVSQSGYRFRCIASGMCGTATSNSAVLNVNPTTNITTQPVASTTVCIGSPYNLAISSSNASSYQWQQSTDGGTTWNNLPSGGNSSYLFSSVSASQSGNQYRCLVTGQCGTVTSSTALLTVATATAITVQPVDQTICTGSNANFSVTAVGNNLSYQWEVSTNSGSSWTTMSGETSSSLVVPSSTVLCSFCNRYRCIVRSSCSPTSVTSAVAALTVLNYITITQQPVSSTVCAGASASFSCAAPGATSFQWQESTDDGANFVNINGATSQTYTIAASTISQSGYIYRCVTSSSCGVATSTGATLTVNPNEAIVQQPSSQTICSGGNATFTLQATGLNLIYQWQQSTDGGANWTTINGATAATYTISSASSSQSGNQYRCIVTGSCGNITSAIASLTVNESVVIAQQPISQTVCQESPVIFNVDAIGLNLTYQWQVSSDGGTTWGNLLGETEDTLLIAAANFSQNGNQYRCLLNGDCNSVTSTNASLLVNEITTITQQPVHQTICEGNNAVFSVAATGAGLTYQWQQSTDSGATWTDINGQTNALFTITTPGIAESGNQYRCIVEGSCGRVLSSVATLTVNLQTTITQQPISQSVCQGSNVSFEVAASGGGISYQWQVSADDGNSWTSLVGATSSSYAISGVLNTLTGKKYRCIVSGSCGNITSAAATLTVNTLTAITQQPAAQTVCEGGNTSFTIAASGSNITYQWQKSEAGFGTVWTNISGANGPVYSITGVLLSESETQFRCVINGECGVAISNEVMLTVNPTTVVTQEPSSGTVCIGDNFIFSVSAAGINLSYQWQVSTNNGASWSTITGATAANYTIVSASASLSGNQYRCVINGSCGTSTSSPATITVNPSTIVTTQPSSQTVCVGASANFTIVANGINLSYQWQESVDGGTTWININGANTTGYTIAGVTTTQSGYKYRCVVTGDCGIATSGFATISLYPNTTVTNHPNSQTICEGAATSFSVSANGNALTYQWQVSSDGGSSWTNIAGATNSLLSITGAALTQNGYKYRCVVNGTCGTVTSNFATLTINPTTVVTQPPVSQTACVGSTATFTVTAIGVNLSYQWQVSTDGGVNWSPINNATNSSLILSSITLSQSGNKYRCLISGTCGNATSTAATLSINPLTAITTQPIAQTICLGSNVTYSVVGIGANLNYQWQVSSNGGTSWTAINGATNNNYTIISPVLAMSTNQYRCIVSSDCGPSVTSSPALLTIHTPPVFTMQPNNTEVCVGTNVTLTSTAVGFPATQYQWQLSTNSGSSWTNISGANNTALSLPSVILAMNGNQYRCLVSNNTCSSPVISTVATLRVRSIPTATLSAAPYTSILPGQTTVLTANNSASTGGVISNFWTLNGQTITPTSPTSHNVTVQGLGIYQVRINETWSSGLTCSSLSPTITIGAEASSRLFVFPSPNNGIFSVSYYYNGSAASTRQLHVYDFRGSLVYKRTFTIAGPYTIMQVNMESAARGLYRIVIGDASGNKLVDGNVLIH